MLISCFFLFSNFQKGTSGPIGTAIKSLNDNLKAFVAFVPIPTKVPELDIALFNGKQDLLCLYELCRGVALGQDFIDPKYLHKKLPDISTVRSEYIN